MILVIYEIHHDSHELVMKVPHEPRSDGEGDLDP